LINKKDVITIKVPFPDINSGLAIQSHMYVCLQNGDNKEIAKCQRFKPCHIKRNSVPQKRVVETPDINRNPFSAKTIIDCDKIFILENVKIDISLLATRRRNVSVELFNEITSKIDDAIIRENIDTTELLTLNRKMSPVA
jgi:hypothetical protein